MLLLQLRVIRINREWPPATSRTAQCPVAATQARPRGRAADAGDAAWLCLNTSICPTSCVISLCTCACYACIHVHICICMYICMCLAGAYLRIMPHKCTCAYMYTYTDISMFLFFASHSVCIHVRWIEGRCRILCVGPLVLCILLPRP